MSSSTDTSLPTDPGQARSWRRDLIVLLASALAVRGLFLYFMPMEVASTDLTHWERVAIALVKGQNPYEVTTHLNWPPLWMTVVYVLAQIKLFLEVDFFRTVICFLILVECCVMAMTLRFAYRVNPTCKPLWVLLIGMALNPAAVLLICQHGNFDVIVGLWVLFVVYFVVAFQRSGDPSDWLLAAFFLGLGIYTKTVPVFLLPLLAIGVRTVPTKMRWVGGALVFVPVIIGMSVIYTLGPEAVTQNVLRYRSYPGFFGITGLFRLIDKLQLASIYGPASSLAMLGVMLLLCWRMSKIAKLSAAGCTLLAGLLLLQVPLFGNGYGPQYLYWFLPVFVASAIVVEGSAYRIMLLMAFIVCALTYMVEYSTFKSHGSALGHLFKERMFERLIATMSQPRSQVLVRLPLFACYLALFTLGFKLIRKELHRPEA